ncbi:KaiC domain-containing protein [Halobellus limi]|uniref:KaiC domain-containing protein n=1 Tax=Halobellus limi TaxID=699433 RepID=A0A4D6H6E4_9EURY|nr:KaiC domain-containing protein [Halobellus limi]QCC48848.1 KaiC domain-containing protein [Halobellus limi]
MSDDDDWFERALREEEGAEDVSPKDGDSSPKGGESDGDVPPGSNGSKSDSPSPDGSAGEKTDGEAPTDGAEAAAGPSGGDGPADSEEDPFGQDFATALENAPDPGTDRPSGFDGGANEPSSAESDDGFGDFGGGGGFGGEGGSGGDEFGSGGNDFGFGDPSSEGDAFGPAGGEEEFDEEAFDSDLERLEIGIEGLDSMILGGVPRRSLMVAVGSAGTGKTTFGLQFLNHGLENGESAVYITLEESHDRILDTAGEKGWDFEGYVEEGRLAVVDIDPIEMANSLDSIQNDLPDLIEEFGADRLVLDSVSLLEMMYESAPKRRSQVFGFTRALKNAGITTLLTSEASAEDPYTSRFGIVEYLADAVFVLQYVRESDFRETRLAVEIQKIRDANHSRATKPYELTESGISVYRQANIF